MRLFLDIETVPQQPRGRQMELFTKKFSHKLEDHQTPEEYYKQNASFYAEFAQVVCVSIAEIREGNLLIESHTGSEFDILWSVAKRLYKATELVAHNGMDFDYPFLYRRMLIQNVTVPRVLNPVGKKPWEMALRDTQDMWSGTQFKYRCSLDLIASCMGLPSPKQTMDGSMVAQYYAEGRIDEIKSYCELDVRTLVAVWMKIMQYKEFESVKP